MTLIEPLLIAVVGLGVFVVGVACGSVAVSAVGAVVFVGASVVVVTGARRIGRAHAAWQKMPTQPTPSLGSDDVKDL